ncbi:MAG: histidine kinase [Saccharofermentans sp.]|nr:histidine kinase [Saccharofermentans sp.]
MAFIIEGGQSGTAFIVLTLIGALIVVLSENLRGLGKTALIYALLPLLWFIIPEASILLPVCGYVLMTGVFPLKSLDSIRIKYSREKPLAGVDSQNIIIMFISILPTLITAFFVGCNHMPLWITGAAIFLGITRSIEEGKNIHAIEGIDKLRSDTLEANNRQRIATEKQKEAVYMATLQERNRIAREIHDNVGHLITRCLVQMQAIRIINKDPIVGAQLESVNDTMNQAMTSIRKSVHALHDESIDLSIEINEAASILKDRFDVDVTTVIDDPVTTEILEAIVALIKESCTNISKYSKGKKATVEVAQNVTFYRVKIWDDGVNDTWEYNGKLTAKSGMGLSDMCTRIENLGGRINISSNKEGFTVFATIPRGEK